MTCDAHLHWGTIAVDCDLPADHGTEHGGTYLQTRVTWQEGDRRNYHGDPPGPCDARGTGVGGLPVNVCVLPRGHHGDHAF